MLSSFEGIEFSKEQSLSIVEKDEKHVVIESLNKRSRLVIDFAPLHFSYFVNNELKISINDKNLFYFEVTREKLKTASSEVIEEKEEKVEKKIVDYTEAGHAIYEDGTTEVPREVVEEIPVAETPSVSDDTDKEDENGYWEEYFGGKTDKKPWGPQSVGADVTFHDVDALYGIPQHSSATKLQSTVNGYFSDPYRLFNLDVFEFATNKNTALYGSIPFMLGHSTHHTVGFLWLNPTDTFIDIYNEENRSQATQWFDLLLVII